MIELGKKSEIFGVDSLRQLKPNVDIQFNNSGPQGMPRLKDNEKLIVGYDQGVGERMFVCDTLEEMQTLYNHYVAGSALHINFYAGEDPGFITTIGQNPIQDYRELQIKDVVDHKDSISINFYKSAVGFQISKLWLVEHEIDPSKIVSGTKILIKGKLGNEDAMLATFDVLLDLKIIAYIPFKKISIIDNWSQSERTKLTNLINTEIKRLEAEEADMRKTIKYEARYFAESKVKRDSYANLLVVLGNCKHYTQAQVTVFLNANQSNFSEFIN